MLPMLRARWAATVVLAWSGLAGAQPLPPLPPPPAPGAAPASPPSTAPAPPPPSSPSSSPAPPASSPPPPPPPTEDYAPPPPPRVVFVEPPPPVHAPRYSLWLGGRVGVLAYGGGLYVNNQQTGAIETTGNFVGPGLGLEADVGARLAKRFIPYLALELGLTGGGHRFDSANSTSNTEFYGFGFRYLAGDVDTVSFAGDYSFGLRRFKVRNDTGTWVAQGFEIFRLGLGAEIRVNSHFAVSPMFTLSGGTLTDASGSISFAPGQGDGLTGPGTVNGQGGFVPFNGNQSIPNGAQTTYFAIVLGCGMHVDVFGQ